MMRLLSICLALSLSLLALACNQSGYKTFEQTKGYDHYSFEYPASYRITVNSAYSEQNAPNGVRLVGKLVDGIEITMAVNIDSGLGNITERIDKTLTVPGSQLLERYPENISGVSGEVITLYTEPYQDLPAHYEKKAFFDNNGRNWDFFVYSDKDKITEVDSLFEHLFRTFQFLP